MDAPIVTASHGAMRALPGKLAQLLSEPGLGLHKVEKNKLCMLKDDLQGLIDNYLMEPSDVEAPAFTANYWVKEVRELSYDIDDFANELFHAAATAAANAKIIKAPRFKASQFHKMFLRFKTSQLQDKLPHLKASQLQKKLSRRRAIVDEVSSFSCRLKELIELYKCYDVSSLERLPEWQSNETMSLTVPLGEETSRRCYLGMDKDMDKLAGLLENDGQMERKVIAIVGLGGIGKTTLAEEFYHKFGCRFEFQAFVRTSRKPDMKRVLTSLLSQVQQHEPFGAVDVDNLAFEIKSYQKDKRYFIVIDDVWSLATWDIINQALPESSYSRILITTEVDLVAQMCCADKYIFKKEQFAEAESNEFFSRVCESKSGEHLKKISCEIANLCGRLPLIIAIVASILARLPQSIEQWNIVKNSLSSGLEEILNLIYSTLPHPLKACMLYLGIYEEDDIILKDDLLNQWIEEGFISTVDGNDDEGVAQIYFDELISRGLIHPVETRFDYEVMSCRVHYMIIDFIRFKAIEHNFGIAIDNCQTDVRFADKIRRLSLHFGNAKDAITPVGLRWLQVLTLVFFGPFHCTPSVAEFRVLRVLILTLSVDDDDVTYDLTEIAELLGLKYLYINGCQLNIKLPMQMRQLKYLARVNIEAKLRAVPSDIVDLPRLLQLILPSETALPNCMEQMKSLQTLGYFDLSRSSIEKIVNLGKLLNLQNLYMTCSNGEPGNLKNKMKHLALVIDKLRNINSVALVFAGPLDDADSSIMEISSDDFSVSSPPALLWRFEFTWRFIFSSLPKWLKGLGNPSILKIAITEMLRHDIDVLSGLPALISLSLDIQRIPEEKTVFGTGRFSVLKYFKLRGNVPWFKFEADSMPNLQRLKLMFIASLSLHRVDLHGNDLINIEHLSCLRNICKSGEWRFCCRVCFDDWH